MSTRRTRSRALVPMPEDLESRRLLSQTVTGLDEKGDQWVLKLIGPGALRVTKQPDSSGNATALTDETPIDAITVAGTNPDSSRLIGEVKPASGSDGRVFFSSLTDQGAKSEGIVANDGINTIDMPGFYLGQTSTSTSATAPSISIPDGVNTLRFGGADTTYTPPGGTALNTNATADTFTVNLGLPRTIGTSIIVNKVTTDAQAGTTSSTGTANPATQDGVTFTVDGRINQFQANEIDGNTTLPSSGFQGGGGTIVNSTTDPTTGYTGQIGFARVGGNATNFSVMTNDKISNFFIGGETNNVQLLAPNGSRTIQFGKGMDETTILTHYIDTLQANRGALNSTVTVDRNVGNVTIGGDVVNTNIQAGYAQGLATVYTDQTAPTTAPSAQLGGSLTHVLVAGDVTNSVFAASSEPASDGTFGGSDQLLLPLGHIKAKVEGVIDNSTATPDSPTTAFYAKNVEVAKGPVIPPSVAELPFRHSGSAPTGPRIATGLQPTHGNSINDFYHVNSTGKVTAKSTTHVATKVPKGPAVKKK